MAEEIPAPPGAWTGRNLAIVVALLVVTNAITGVSVFFLAAPAQPQVLRVIGPWSGSELDRFQPVMDQFTDDTGIEINYFPVRQEDLQTSLPASFDSAQTPADLIFMAFSFIKAWGEDGHAVDMTSVNGDSDVSPDIFDLVQVGDVQYGGAFTGKAKLGFWYKESFFSDNNLDADVTSYAEFTSLLEEIAPIDGIVNPIVSGDGVGWPLSDITEHFIANIGGADMHRQLTAGTLSWEDATVKDIFRDNLVPWIEAGHFSPPVDFPEPSYTDFCDEDYALYFMGSWITADIAALDRTDCTADDLAYIAMPSTERAIVFSADYFFIPTYSDVQDAAMDFAAFLMSNEGQEIQVGEGGHLATATGVPLEAYPVGLDRDLAAGLVGETLLSDMDDAKGAPFQPTFWSELQALWDDPSQWEAILGEIEAVS